MNVIASAKNNKFVFAAFVLILLTGKIFAAPAVAHAQTYGSYSDSGCCSYSSYVDSIDWYTPASGSSSYVDSIDYSYSGYTPSYVDSIDYSYTPSWSYPSYVDSIDYSYIPYWPSYVDSIDYSYTPSWPSYVDSIDYSYAPSYPSYVDSIDYSYAPLYPSYVDSIDYLYPAYSTGAWPGTTVTPVYAPASGGSYLTPVYTGYSTPQIVVGAPSSPVVAAPVSQYVNSGNTIVSNSGNTTITNSGNTNIVDSYNTNVTNSGNTYYTQPQYVPQPIPTCSINVSSGSSYAGSPMTLSWYSYNATSATVTSLGSVPLSGSRTVNPYTTTTYVMTVSGPGGNSSCSTVAYVAPATHLAPIAYAPTPYYPAPAHHIPLSSVPYTGFDAGPLGNIIYWSALVAWSLFAGYMVVGYQGGLMGAFQRFATSASASDAPAPTILEETVVAPVVNEAPAQPVAVAKPVAPSAHNAPTGTADLLTLEDDGSAPRLVIRRS